MKIKRKNEKLIRGSHNVFAGLGFKPAEAADLQIKAEPTRQIYKRIKELGLTQIQAAERLGISQPDVSKLRNARFTGYSTDRLIAAFSALEVDVDIVVRPRKLTRHHELAVVRVRAAGAAA